MRKTIFPLQVSLPKLKPLNAKKGVVHIATLSVIAVLTVCGLSDYTNYLHQRRSLCEQGALDEAEILSQERSLATSLVAYVDQVLNNEVDPCETVYPDRDLFGEYPPIEHIGGPIPNRPEGTIAYVLVITRCPQFYEPGIDGAPDPGDDIYEASAIIKDEICNATKAMDALDDGTEDIESFKETMYAIINPNGVTCPKPGSTTEFYDRVTMMQDLGFRVEIVGQPITNAHLVDTQPYINQHIEDDVGIRDTTRLHAWRLTEHPAAVIFSYDRIFQDTIDDLMNSLVDNPDLKGYYVRKPACDDAGNSVVDTGFMVIKPSMDEFEKIRQAYINTPYDPVTGWNGEGHNQCDGKLGLPGFFSYYFSKETGYVELDRCAYSFAADEECINQAISQDATTSSEIIDIVENGATEEEPSTPEAALINEATKSATTEIDEVQILQPDGEHSANSVSIVEEETVVVMQVYVLMVTTVKKVRKTTDENGVVTTEVILDNGLQTSSRMVHAIADNPGAINDPDAVDDDTAFSFTHTATSSPSVVTQSQEICGKPTECPPDDPNWSRSQQLACQDLHSTFFRNKRRTELSMKKIEFSDLIGQYKPRSFLGYCKGAGPENYIGLKDAEVAKAPEWQITCEPMYCPFGRYVTSDCTCSSYENPCEACPKGTRCQISPTFLCIDCECGACGSDGSPCCDSGDPSQCAATTSGDECQFESNFFAAISGTGSVCNNNVDMGIWSTPQGCGCRPNNVMPCTFDPNLKDANNSCFACTAADMASGACPGCNFCLGMTNQCISDSQSEGDFRSCLGTIPDADKESCRDMCTKL